MRMGPIGDLSLDWLVGVAPHARRFGVEHEFSVSRGCSAVDFRAVLSARPDAGRRLDRADPFARRLPWGGVVTADGREAECATPPALLAPGFTDRISRWVESGRHELQTLADDAVLSGYSTHLNVEVDDRRAVALADRFAVRHSAALMMLMDGPESPGLLVRPRRSRLEFGAEYVTGEQLVAASVFAAAATKDCEATRSTRQLVTPHVLPARGRFGLYVDRCAFGSDLSVHGRSARVGRYSAQDLLTWSWDRCRIHALDFAAAHEIDVVDGVVDARLPLPSEHRSADDRAPYSRCSEAERHLDVTVARRSGNMTLDPIVATWDHVCFSLVIDKISRVVAVPTGTAARLADAFESGELDSWCRRVAGLESGTLAVLSSADQIGASGVFASIEPDATLMPPERNPRTGRPGGVGNSPGQRQQKNHDDTPPRRIRHTRIALAAAAGLIAIAGAVAVASSDDESSTRSTSTTVTVAVPVSSVSETTVVAAVVPVTDAATTIAPPTTIEPPTTTAPATTVPGPASALLVGQFTGQRTVLVAECTAGPCYPGPPVGDVADRTYDFAVDCSSSPCQTTVAVQFFVSGGTQVLQVPLTFDGTGYSWDVNTTIEQCNFDTDGDGTNETKYGTVDLSIHYELTPTAAEVRDNQYVVTAFSATGDATNVVSVPDPRCVGFGPSHNLSDINASR